MHDYFFDPILKDLIFATDIEIIEKLFLSFGDLSFFIHEKVHVFEILVNIQLFPKHTRILYR